MTATKGIVLAMVTARKGVVSAMQAVEHTGQRKCLDRPALPLVLVLPAEFLCGVPRLTTATLIIMPWPN